MLPYAYLGSVSQFMTMCEADCNAVRQLNVLDKSGRKFDPACGQSQPPVVFQSAESAGTSVMLLLFRPLRIEYEFVKTPLSLSWQHVNRGSKSVIRRHLPIVHDSRIASPIGLKFVMTGFVVGFLYRPLPRPRYSRRCSMVSKRYASALTISSHRGPAAESSSVIVSTHPIDVPRIGDSTIIPDEELQKPVSWYNDPLYTQVEDIPKED
jgi:hypothetical protein